MSILPTEDEMAEHMRRGEYVPPMQLFARHAQGENIADCVLSWMVHHGFLDAGNEYHPSDVLEVLNDLKPIGDETGWVIERGDSRPSAPAYWAGDAWSQDHLDAIRFVRKLDAERVSARMTYPNNRVCEHIWVGLSHDD